MAVPFSRATFLLKSPEIAEFCLQNRPRRGYNYDVRLVRGVVEVERPVWKEGQASLICWTAGVPGDRCLPPCNTIGPRTIRPRGRMPSACGGGRKGGDTRIRQVWGPDRGRRQGLETNLLPCAIACTVGVCVGSIPYRFRYTFCIRCPCSVPRIVAEHSARTNAIDATMGLDMAWSSRRESAYPVIRPPARRAFSISMISA